MLLRSAILPNRILLRKNVAHITDTGLRVLNIPGI